MGSFLKSKILFYLKDVFAQEGEPIVIQPPGPPTLEELLSRIANFLFWLGVAIFPIVIVIVAYLFLTSGGNPQKIQQARAFLLWSSIGLAILLLSRVFANLLKSIFGK